MTAVALDMDTWMEPPLAVLHQPLAKACLAYRRARMPAAKANAAAHGYKGAMYPWESSLTGVETSPAGDGSHGKCSKGALPFPPDAPETTAPRRQLGEASGYGYDDEDEERWQVRRNAS